MRKSAVIALNLLGLVAYCIMAGVGVYCALSTTQNDPTAQLRFVIGFLLDFIAGLVLTATIYVEDEVKTKLRGLRCLKVIYDFAVGLFILGPIFLSLWVIDAYHNSFCALMALTALLCSMAISTCPMVIVNEIAEYFQAKKPTP